MYPLLAVDILKVLALKREREKSEGKKKGKKNLKIS